jgi:hypothetical protein
MLLTPAEHAPRARCDTCGSPEIFTVCHHCGKCLCRSHTSRAVDLRGRPASKELDGLGLEGEQAAVFHCAEHYHVVQGGGLLPYILAGAGVAVLGAVVIFFNLVAGLVLLLLGVGAAIGCYLVQRGRKADGEEVMPAFPVIPNLESVSVRETFLGRICLQQDGTYTSRPQPLGGTVEVMMTLNNWDRARLSDYQAKYGLEAADPVAFSAGFAVLGGEAGLIFEPESGAEQWLLPGGTAISFHGEVAGHPLFSTGRSRTAGRWTVRLPYRLQGARAPASVPLWIVPSLVPGSDMRTLELEVHWGTLDQDRSAELSRQLKLLRFDSIELGVPTAWGYVEEVSPGALISNPEMGLTRTIEWKLLAPEITDPPGAKKLTIRFEKPIRLESTLTGRLRASFKGTFSGITDVGMYWPTGSRWQQPPKAKVTTQAEVDFELSLNYIRYQDVRVVPDGSRDPNRPEIESYPGVIPSHDTVIDLTNELSNAGYYVKRITENQPRGGGRSSLVNRVWDIAGRQYWGVFPIDFHIAIMGEEEYQNGEFHPRTGNTAVRLTVLGSYVNREMEAQVEDMWDTLNDIVTTKLKALVSPPPPYSQPGGPSYQE